MAITPALSPKTGHAIGCGGMRQIGKHYAVLEDPGLGRAVTIDEKMPIYASEAHMSDFDYDKLREEGRIRARSTAVWDVRFCTKEYWEYQMSVIPHDVIGADLTKHAPHGSYSPKFWYRDERFQCRDCGKSEVWTAQQQQWWFEVAKGQINSVAIRCRACRQAYRKKSGKRSHAERMARRHGR